MNSCRTADFGTYYGGRAKIDRTSAPITLLKHSPFIIVHFYIEHARQSIPFGDGPFYEPFPYGRTPPRSPLGCQATAGLTSFGRIIFIISPVHIKCQTALLSYTRRAFVAGRKWIVPVIPRYNEQLNLFAVYPYFFIAKPLCVSSSSFFFLCVYIFLFRIFFVLSFYSAA